MFIYYCSITTNMTELPDLPTEQEAEKVNNNTKLRPHFTDLEIGQSTPFLHNRVYQAENFDETRNDVKGARVLAGKAEDRSFTGWQDSVFNSVQANNYTNFNNKNITFFNGDYGDNTGKRSEDVQAFETAFGNDAFKAVQRFTGVNIRANNNAFANSEYVTLINSALKNNALEDARFADVRVTNEESLKELKKEYTTVLADQAMHGARDSQLSNVPVGEDFGHYANNLFFIGGEAKDGAFFGAEDVYGINTAGEVGKIYKPRSGILLINNVDEVIDPGYESTAVIFSTKRRPGTKHIESSLFENIGAAVQKEYERISQQAPQENPKVSDTVNRMSAPKNIILQKTYNVARDKFDDQTTAYVEKQLDKI